MAKITRRFFHYEELEEFHAGMWRIVTGQEAAKYRDAAAALMRNPERFKDAMEAALLAWPKSCSAALSAEATNRLAWLGHAGCCIETGSPEGCTRLGWRTLNQRQQDEANRVAGEVVRYWESQQPKEQDDELDLWGWAESA